ncbi:glutamate racemase [Patescibacteria group bacterium]|nr:MAG: glutamate racemase [Patescibacteria group bacterium]
MLGVFDSGYGGLSVLRAIHRRLPELSTFYFGDNARAPYGGREQEEIFRFTLEGVHFLLSRGCPLVIVACNTASAGALRRIQQTVLPREFAACRVLGVIRPYAEAAALESKNGHIGVLGTAATVESGAYSRELENARRGVVVSEVASPELAGLVEAGQEKSAAAREAAKRAMDKLLGRDPAIDTVLLACTHFPLVWRTFERIRPKNVRYLPQASIVAEKLEDYLERHPEIESHLEKTSRRLYATSAEPVAVSKLATKFYGQPIKVVSSES